MATDQVLRDLTAEDRLILAAYFLDGRTLADIAKMLSVHESTISRKLDRLAKSLRKSLLKNLRARGMSLRQAQEALEVDVRDLGVNVRRSLQETRGVAFSEEKVQAERLLE